MVSRLKQREKKGEGVVAAFKEQRGGFACCSVGTLDGERWSGAVRSSEGDGAMDRWRRRLCGDGDRAATVSPDVRRR